MRFIRSYRTPTAEPCLNLGARPPVLNAKAEDLSERRQHALDDAEEPLEFAKSFLVHSCG